MEREQLSLQHLGFSEKEALLYMCALELRVFSVQDISQKSSVKRPTCYVILEELLKKGVISIVPRVRKRLYSVESPEVVLQQAEKNFILAKGLLPSLFTHYHAKGEKPMVKFYSGQKGIRNIYEDTLQNEAKKLYYVGSSKQLVEMVGKDYLDEYIDRRVRKGIKAYTIRMKKTEFEEGFYQETKTKLREIRYAPGDIYIEDSIFIYNDKVAVVSTKKGNFGFMVESREFAQSMMGLFQALWRISVKK